MRKAATRSGTSLANTLCTRYPIDGSTMMLNDVVVVVVDVDRPMVDECIEDR